MRKTVNKTTKLAGTAMLAALSTVLMFFSFNVPLMPSFIKMDFSELPALVASFAYGPIYGVAVCAIKNLINLMATTTGGVGELSNFILGVLFVVPAGLIYSKNTTKKGAIIGAFAGAVVMAVCSVVTNYYVVYPVYTAFMPMEAIMGMYNAILTGIHMPNITNLMQALLIFNMPFTFIKGIIIFIISTAIYGSLSFIMPKKAK